MRAALSPVLGRPAPRIPGYIAPANWKLDNMAAKWFPDEATGKVHMLLGNDCA